MYKQEFKEFVEYHFNTIVKCGLFDNYDISFIYEDKDEPHESDASVCTKMAVKAYTEYLSLKVFIYPDAQRRFEKLDNETFIKRYITHELSHTRTTPLAELAREREVNDREITAAEENLTERYSRLVNYYLEKENYFNNHSKVVNNGGIK